jgi:hypothetical protein
MPEWCRVDSVKTVPAELMHLGAGVVTKQPKRYDEAVSILQDLHDLAETNGTSSAFSLRMENLSREHENKRTLLDRLRKARLLVSAASRTLMAHG